MFGKKYYGLTGNRLNMAIGIIAGMDVSDETSL